MELFCFHLSLSLFLNIGYTIFNQSIDLMRNQIINDIEKRMQHVKALLTCTIDLIIWW